MCALSHQKLACRKVYGKQGEAARVLKKHLLLSNPITRSPSSPGYIGLPADEQRGIQMLYHLKMLFVYDRNAVSSLQRRVGIYVKNPCLRYALLTFTATYFRNTVKTKLYWTQFQNVVRNISRTNVHLDNMHAFVFMANTTFSTGSWDERQRYLEAAAEILDDINNNRVKIDLATQQITLEDIIHCLRAIETCSPLARGTSTPGGSRLKLSSFDLTLSQCGEINDAIYDSLFPGKLGRKFTAYCEYVHDIFYSVKTCFNKYLECKLGNSQSSSNIVGPLLRHLQNRIGELENDEFFCDLVAMDALFISRRSRPVGSINTPYYKGIYYTSSSLDWYPRIHSM